MSLFLGALFLLACGGSQSSTNSPSNGEQSDSGELTAEGALEEIKVVVDNICACENKECLVEIAEAFQADMKRYEDSGIEPTDELKEKIESEVSRMTTCISDLKERLSE